MSDPEVLVIALDLMAKQTDVSVLSSIVRRNTLIDRGILKSPQMIKSC